MKQCTIQIRDEVNIKLEGLDLDVRKKLVNTFIPPIWVVESITF